MPRKYQSFAARSKITQVVWAAGATAKLDLQELAALDSSVQAVELKLREVQRYIHQEKQAVDKATALISARSVQRDQLQYISTHLPTRLPQAAGSQATQHTAGLSALIKETSGDELSDTDENLDSANMEPQPAPTRPADDRKKRAKAPRRCSCNVTFIKNHCNTISSTCKINALRSSPDSWSL